MTIKDGTHVTWHYRGAIGHGTVVGVHKPGKTEAGTEYTIAEHDHHVSASGSHEKAHVYHYGSALTEVSKNAAPEQRYLLGIAYQAGPDPAIMRGADGHRDYFTPAELEKAAWSFMAGDGRRVGLFHGPDETIGHFKVTESYIYRGPDWPIGDAVVKAGDWLIGGTCDEVAWGMVKADLITGFSPQGAAKRRSAST